MKKTAEDEASKREGAEAMEAQPGPAAETETAGNPAASAPETGETKAESGGKADQVAGDAASAGAAKDLAARVDELEKSNAELKDQYLRKAADFDNYRKRMLKEKQEAIDFANASLLVDLVQILDDFDRAIDAGGQHEPGTPAAAFADGIAMIRSRLGSMLESKYSLAYYPAKGEHFDPNVHEAIGTVPVPGLAEPTVAEEFVKGYKLRDRVIRLAKVMVNMPAEGSN
jgi:molecular chaperone GrpE